MFYKEKCKKSSIPINHHAVLCTQKDPFVQTTLNASMPPKAPSTPFTSTGLLNYIIELIVSEDNVGYPYYFTVLMLKSSQLEQAFCLVNKAPFSACSNIVVLHLQIRTFPIVQRFARRFWSVLQWWRITFETSSKYVLSLTINHRNNYKCDSYTVLALSNFVHLRYMDL